MKADPVSRSIIKRRQLRMLVVGNFLSHNGGSRGVCEELAPRLVAEGHRVITTSAQRNKLLRLVDMVQTTWRERASYDVALVDVYSGPAFFWAEAACWTLRRAGKPYILTLHGGNLPAFAQRWPRRVSRLLAGANVVTTPSRYLLEQINLYRNDLVLLPNPIDLSAYAYAGRYKPAPALVWLRAFHSLYNPSLLPKVVAILARDFPDVRATMIGPDKGDGSFRATQRLAKQLAVSSRFSFPGGVPKPETPRWLNQGDIFINTTNIDNTPISVIEAMACGLPVVSTNVGGIPYMVEHERDVLLVPPDDPQAMAAAIRRVLSDAGLSENLTSNARKKVEAFDWPKVLPLWEELLKKVLE